MGQPCKRNTKRNDTANTDAMLKQMLHSANIANQTYHNDYIRKKLADSTGNYKSRYKSYTPLYDDSVWASDWYTPFI